MTTYQTDQFGLPLDPHMRALEIQVTNLAGMFRATRDKAERREIAAAYRNDLQTLRDLGWQGPLDVTATLPPDFMPTWYFEQYPDPEPFFYRSREDMLAALEKKAQEARARAARHQSQRKRNPRRIRQVAASLAGFFLPFLGSGQN